LVFTYFDEALQERMLRDIVERMRPGGALVIGNSETLPKGDFGMTAWAEKWGVFKRTSNRA
jgi:chemotaxis methyl-accepting protein methylase